MSAMVIGLVLAGSSPAAGRAQDNIQPVQLHLSNSERAQWQSKIATAAGRAQVVSDMQAAFAGVATVGTGQRPSTATRESAGEVRNVAYTASVRHDVAWGITADHFWIIVSYADVVSGAIWAAVRACQTRLPGWLCTNAGNLLVSWAQGWGSASDHGVWAAVYWWPPHITGGRW
ncbi:hypothetical protein [Actinophytocola sp.]|uniref:hypothetical protein n=1 Tax=Actinophytocola sp. TaxID=1872138 RepID=UPI003899F0A2